MSHGSWWNVECDLCGFVYKSYELRRNWKGQMVCQKDFETRHPLDFFRARIETQNLPYIRDRKFKYRCYATLSADDAAPTTGAWTKLALNTEIADAYAEFTTGTNTFRPTATESREFRFGVSVSAVSGTTTLNVALYKNGSAVKTLDTITSYGETRLRLAGVYTDSAATNTDDYTVYYYITGSTATIEAEDSGTFLEVK